MSKFEKLLQRFLSKRGFYLRRAREYWEVSVTRNPARVRLGSRVAFINRDTGHIIRLHKPHPDDTLKFYQIGELENELRKQGLV